MCEIIQINYRVNVDEWHVFLNLALDLKIIFQSCYLLFVWPKGMSRRRRRKLGVFIRSSVIGWMVCWLDVSSGCRTHSPSSSSTPKVELEWLYSMAADFRPFFLLAGNVLLWSLFDHFDEMHNNLQFEGAFKWSISTSWRTFSNPKCPLSFYSH